MYKLISCRDDFKVNTVDMNISHSERSSLSVFLDISYPSNNFKDYIPVSITFEIVAKFEYTELNFWEHNQENYQIYNPDNYFLEFSNFYMIENSKWESFLKIADKKNRFNLTHFIIMGYDSYLEILAKDYTSQEVLAKGLIECPVQCPVQPSKRTS